MFDGDNSARSWRDDGVLTAIMANALDVRYYCNVYRAIGLLVGFFVASYVVVDWFPAFVPGRGFIILVLAIEAGEYCALAAKLLRWKRDGVEQYDTRRLCLVLLLLCLGVGVNGWIFALGERLLGILPAWMRAHVVPAQHTWQSITEHGLSFFK